MCDMCSTSVLCQANIAHVRQSGPGSGLGILVRVLEPFKVVSTWERVSRQGMKRLKDKQRNIDKIQERIKVSVPFRVD